MATLYLGFGRLSAVSVTLVAGPRQTCFLVMTNSSYILISYLFLQPRVATGIATENAMAPAW